MRVHRSNRLELLVDGLAGQLKRPLSGPFVQELIAVPSLGMARWLQQQLSRRLGVVANCRFPFPRALLDELLELVTGGGAGPRPDERAQHVALVLAIHAELPGLAALPAAEPVRAYLAGDGGTLKLLELAQQLAELFDQYVVYRPEVVRGWDQGQDADQWQAELFRRVHTRLPMAHLALRAERAKEQLLRGGPVGALPERVAVFGASTLPPLFLELFGLVGAHTQVDVHLLAATPHWAGDVVGERSALRQLSVFGGDAALDAADLHLDGGSALLASLGRVQRELQLVLETRVRYEPGQEPFEEPRTDTALGVLQSDVFHLTARGEGAESPVEVDAADRSVEVHACYGPLREVEALYARLVDAFERDPTLTPEDVLVTAPDLETYAPLIDAVFGAATDGPGRIPYAVADRRRSVQSFVSRAVLAALTLTRSRVALSDVIDFLALPPVRERFELAPEEVDVVHERARAAGIRWGFDAEHRASEGLPPEEEHSFRFGLERLLFGAALALDGRTLVGPVLPIDLEGTEARLIGRFAALLTSLHRLRDELAAPATTAAWAERISALQRLLIADTDETEAELRELRAACSRLARGALAVGHDGELPVEAFELLLRGELDRTRSSNDFLRGGVTVAALLPMRSLPFRLIAVLGLSDGEFPRREVRPTFDLVAGHALPGDRDPREEDRNLFLELLLSARERLLLSYVGRSQQSDEKLPPSAVVAELLDVASKSLRARSAGLFSAGGPLKLLVEHPLQSFSAQHFRIGVDDRLRGFAGPEARAAEARALRPRPRKLLTAPLPPLAAPGEVAEVALADFVACFERPTRAFVLQRLGVRLDDEGSVSGDREPTALDGLESYALGALVLDELLLGAEPAQIERLARARGLLPPGRLGAFELSRQLPTAEGLAEHARGFVANAERPPLLVDLPLGPLRLRGALDRLRGDVQLAHGYARANAGKRLAWWLRHVVLCACRESDDPGRTVHLARGATRDDLVAYELGTLSREQARAALVPYVDAFLLAQRVPLPFFPGPAEHYLRQLERGQEQEPAARAAQKRFRSDEDRDGPYLELVWLSGELDPFHERFRWFPEEPALNERSFTEHAETLLAPAFAAEQPLG